MGQSAIPAAVMARDPQELRAAIVSELVPIIPANVDPQTWDPRELPGVGGNAWQAVIWQERLWYRDEDALDDHDEITCIRLLDGVAYLTNDVEFPDSVLSRTVETPPTEEDSPAVAYGDTYRIPAGATDEWAGHENDEAMYTARGWIFRTPKTGNLHYVVDEVGYEHFNAEDEWEDGFGALVFENGSVRPNSLLIRSWAVENQTTNTLPATGPAAEQYIVGPSPTGDAVGQTKKIAWRPATDAAFIFTAPLVGETAFDKDLNIDIRWNGTAWISASGTMVGYARAHDGGATPGLWNSGGDYTWSGSSPPTSSHRSYADPTTINDYTPKNSGTTLEFEWDGYIVNNNVAGIEAIGIVRDGETAPIAYRPLFLAISGSGYFSRKMTALSDDDQPHTYRPVFFGGNNFVISSLAGIEFTLKEFA